MVSKLLLTGGGARSHTGGRRRFPGSVGSQSRHLLTLLEANPGNPALCLSLSQTQDAAAGTPTCGPFGESNTCITPAGKPSTAPVDRSVPTSAVSTG